MIDLEKLNEICKKIQKEMAVLEDGNAGWNDTVDLAKAEGLKIALNIVADYFKIPLDDYHKK